MSKPPRSVSFLWLLLPLAALVFLFWIDSARIQRVTKTSLLAQEAPATDARSSTGYAANTRVLVVPEHNSDTYHWIAQTQQMLANGTARVHHIDYENAPFGREVHATSVYRWWLAGIAWCDHMISDRPLGQSVERAALYADPILHVLLVLGLTAFAYFQFGALAAGLASVAAVLLFPLGAEYLPGMTEERGLALAFSVATILLIAAGIRAAYSVSTHTPARAARWFFASGIVGALGLWTNAASQIPVIVGIAVGGLLAAIVQRRGASG